MFERSKLESLRDVSVTRIGNTLSFGFPQTVLSENVSTVKYQNFESLKPIGLYLCQQRGKSLKGVDSHLHWVK